MKQGGVEETKGEAEDTVAQMVEGERDKKTADDVSRLTGLTTKTKKQQKK